MKKLLTIGLIFLNQPAFSSGQNNLKDAFLESPVGRQFEFTHRGAKFNFALIRAGSFQMGSPRGETHESRQRDERQHPVTISRDFLMQTTEVTRGQWKAVFGCYPEDLKAESGDNYITRCAAPGERREDRCYSRGKRDDHPVACVSWHDAQRFVRKLNAAESGDPYRLPTEAQWEFAARCGTTGPYSKNGVQVSAISLASANIALFKENSGGRTHPVATLKANECGLFDVHGNVSEWVEDAYSETYPSEEVDPEIIAGKYRVVRGGGWNTLAQFCRSASRLIEGPKSRVNGVGFRLARTATGKFEPSYQSIEFSIEELDEALEKLSDTTPKPYNEFYKALSSKVDELPLTGGRSAANTNYEARAYLLMAIELLVTGFDSDYFKENVHASYNEAFKELTVELGIESKEDLRSSSKIVGIRLDLSIEALKVLKRSVKNEQAQELNEFLSELGSLKARLDADTKNYYRVSEELSGVIDSYEELLGSIATNIRSFNFTWLVQSVK